MKLSLPDSNDSPVTIELSNLNASDGIKKKIREEFKYICELLDFDKKAHEIFRNWYIDGRLYYNKVIDQKNPSNGIQELRYIDSMKMKYIRQVKKQNNNGLGSDQRKKIIQQPIISLNWRSISSILLVEITNMVVPHRRESR